MLLDNTICQTERCVLQSRVVLNFSQKIPNGAKICPKDHFMCFYLFYPGDLVSHTGEREIQSVYGRLPIWESWLR